MADKPGAPALSLTGGELRFDDVAFAYRTEDGDTEALRGVSFAVGPGQTLGIVGPPGAGKSTIAHLVPRFYDVTGGRITIDGQDVRDVTLDSLRTAVGVIQQDSYVFTSALERNVAYGDPWADRDRIAHATASAQLATWVRSLPLGYRTLVGERGVSLSGGQRQRLSIARSVMLRPPIMIFDDSTAAIDAGTEQRIRASLREVTRQCATIIIAHRLSSLMHADEILFLDQGRVVERGSHAELLALCGRYAALYELQARRTSGTAQGDDTPDEARVAQAVAAGGNGTVHLGGAVESDEAVEPDGAAVATGRSGADNGAADGTVAAADGKRSGRGGGSARPNGLRAGAGTAGKREGHGPGSEMSAGHGEPSGSGSGSAARSPVGAGSDSGAGNRTATATSAGAVGPIGRNGAVAGTPAGAGARPGDCSTAAARMPAGTDEQSGRRDGCAEDRSSGAAARPVGDRDHTPASAAADEPSAKPVAVPDAGAAGAAGSAAGEPAAEPVAALGANGARGAHGSAPGGSS